MLLLRWLALVFVHLFVFVFSPGTLTYRMVLPTLIVSLPASVNLV